MKSPARPPIIGFVANSGTGKTTLLTKLLPLLRKRGLSIGVIKHAHHKFDIDYPGKDSHTLRTAGASPVLIASAHRLAMVVEHAAERDPTLTQCIAHMCACSTPDLIIVEGFKHESYAKIELHRPALGHPLLCTHDAAIIAVATDQPCNLPPSIGALDLNNSVQIANFVDNYYQTQCEQN